MKEDLSEVLRQDKKRKNNFPVGRAGRVPGAQRRALQKQPKKSYRNTLKR